ncbi:MAG: Gfo/Idh/MocA family oxidoreductase [Neomegalonema sp.]|nr:Gfo/Idh/MocA family oxidoreductase [Neomegalonema sp.]
MAVAMDAPAPRIAVVGAGLIGRRHAAAVARTAQLAAIVEPNQELGAAVAEQFGAPWSPSLADLIAGGEVDGVILATPNQAHVAGGEACVAAGLPVLIEKPLCDDLAAGRRLVSAAEAAGAPLAVGHHRRHNPIIRQAKALIDEGRLGRIATASAFCMFYKPDAYFDVAWRSQPGGGPVYINLAHDIDLLRFLCGPIAEVSAMEANAIRGGQVEDSAVVNLRFASGAIGAMTISDTVVSPWSWELTARENPAYPATDQNAYFVGGEKASLALPNLTLWRHDGAPSWNAPISAARTPIAFADPIDLQAAQFAAVIQHGEAPLVSGRDGLAAVAVIEAIKRSAATGAPQFIED